METTQQHGLYLYRQTIPIYTGTKKECKDRVTYLKQIDRARGWTIAPVDAFPPCPWDRPMPKSQNIMWALVGAAALLVYGGLFVHAVLDWLKTLY